MASENQVETEYRLELVLQDAQAVGLDPNSLAL
jgi:hypothetical protein